MRKHKFLMQLLVLVPGWKKIAGVPVFSNSFLVSPLSYCHPGRSAPSPPLATPLVLHNHVVIVILMRASVQPLKDWLVSIFII